MARPAHMAGIDNLPSMRAYNDALSNARNGADRATRTLDEARALTKQLETLRTKALFDQYGPANLTKTLDKQINKETKKALGEKQRGGQQATSLDQIKKAAAAGKTLWADQDSDCFASLSWQNGIATATFYHGGQIEYTYDVDLETFLEWANSDSLGGFFNDVIR
jgi:hypothetical protein